MVREKKNKLNRSIFDLKSAMNFYKKFGDDEPSTFLALAKAFEVATEYAWKELKRQLEEKGVTDIYAPKDVIRKAAQSELLSNAERWLDYIDARNDSVHDYYGMTQSEYIELVHKFIGDAEEVFADDNS